MRTDGVLMALVGIAGVLAQPHCAERNTTSTAPAAVAASTDKLLPRTISSASTAIKRFQQLLIGPDGLFTGDTLRKVIVFDFNGARPAPGSLGGTTKAADIETFPFSRELGMSMTIGTLEPCGINTPHIHPRATEFLILVEGSNLRFGSVLENGLVAPGQSQEIAGHLDKLQATMFPPGSMHYQFNDACERATFVASFNSEDPGTSQMAQNLFSLNSEVVNATLGFPRTVNGISIDEFRRALPPNLALDVQGCMARCSSAQRGQEGNVRT